MLMLTHTWILKEFLGPRALDPGVVDLYAYNVSPDLLTFHPDVTSEMTHAAARFRDLPPPHRKGAFVHFHLLVDDIAHYGHICDPPPAGVFNPDSAGYTYARGRPLVDSILALQRRFGNEITRSEAAYQSHILIEMAFDLALNLSRDKDELVSLFSRSLEAVAEGGLEAFGRTLAWLTDIGGDTAGEAFTRGKSLCTPERMKGLMNPEGRINLFIEKFGLDRNDLGARAGAIELMREGMELVRDYESFLQPTLEKIRASAFRYAL